MFYLFTFSINGVSSFTAFCAIIAETLINNLSAATFASCKTFAHGATVILALSTLLIGYDISHPIEGGVGPVLDIFAYLIILMGSTSAANLVRHGEAQLGRLTRAYMTGVLAQDSRSYF